MSLLSDIGGIPADVGKLFSFLTDRHTLIRIGEGVLGITLILIGTVGLLANTEVGKAAAKGLK